MDTYHLTKVSWMHNVYLTLLLTILLSAASLTQAADDTILPASVNIQSDYVLSNSLVTVDDTLTISRTVINNEAQPLTCFYFNENLPNEFTIISHSVTINDIPVSYDYPTPAVSAGFTNYTEYYFVLDYPGTHGTYDLLIQPDDTVVVVYEVTCSTVGSYDLPLHTIIAHDGTTGIFGFSDSLIVQFDVSLDIDNRQNLPNSFSLGQNYPNPFNPTTTIEFSIPERSFVTIEIYNLLGQSVTTLVQQNLPAGNHFVKWNGLTKTDKSAPSGVYFYKLMTQNREISKKMLLLK